MEFKDRLIRVLSDIFGSQAELRSGNSGIDAYVEVNQYGFVVEFKRDSSIRSITSAVNVLRGHALVAFSGQIPLLVVPFMSATGKSYCAAENVSWLDLTGNVNIRGKNLIVKIQGQPNLYKKKGRPRNPFARKSSRIVRIMLSNPSRAYRQHELAALADISDVLVSHAVNGLLIDGYAERLRDRSVQLTNPVELLHAWLDDYQLSKHKIIKGHVSAGAGVELTEALWKIFSSQGIEHAFTGLAAAWMMAPMSMYRLSAVYLKENPSDALLAEMRFQKEPRGANTWLIVPDDKGIFWRAKKYDDIPCVSPIQVLLDLQDHPERSREAAEEITDKYFEWSRNG